MTVTATLAPQAVYDALRNVIDPELGLDIVTLGLVYDVAIVGDAVRVTFSPTTPGCPMEGPIRGGVVAAVSAIAGVGRIDVDLVWDPPWHPRMVAEGAL
jgi:metal-sulfur cluster biosynthetic enzyme